MAYDSANSKLLLYLNGVFDAESSALSLPLGSDANPLFVGNDYSNADPFDAQGGGVIPPSRGFSGAIDDVRIFDELLTLPMFRHAIFHPRLL